MKKKQQLNKSCLKFKSNNRNKLGELLSTIKQSYKSCFIQIVLICRQG